MLATLLGGPLAAADRAPFETVRGWTVERRGSETGSPACRMTHTEKDAQGELAGVVIVSIDRGGLTLAVADRNWDFSAGDRFSVPMLLDGKPAGATLIWTGDGQILRTALPETIVPALLDARTLSLRFADGDKPLVAPDFAAAVGCATPLFTLTQPVYAQAMAMGLGDHDTASVFEVLKRTLVTDPR